MANRKKSGEIEHDTKLVPHDLHTEFEILQTYDEETRKERAIRLQFILKYDFKSGGLVMPMLAYLYYNEAKWCYVDGSFVGCTLLCQMAMDQLLRSYYHWSGTIDDKKLAGKLGFFDLLGIARGDRIISKTEYDLMHKIRLLRKGYVHPKGIDVTMKFLKTSYKNETFNLYRVEVEDDARKAWKCLMTILKGTERTEMKK